MKRREQKESTVEEEFFIKFERKALLDWSVSIDNLFDSAPYQAAFKLTDALLFCWHKTQWIFLFWIKNL